MLKSSKFTWPYNNSCLRVKNRNLYYILIDHTYKGLEEVLKLSYICKSFEYKNIKKYKTRQFLFL